MKLALGTAQFGLDYGINNKKGKISKKEAYKILDFAIRNDINFLDTAYSYGDCEIVIGDFIKETNANFKIISKFSSDKTVNINKVIQESLDRLHSDRLYGYLIHNFQYYLKYPQQWSELEKIRDSGKIEKIGFSFYFPKEVQYLLERDIHFDIAQVPINIFDQRFQKLFTELKKKNVEIYARSIFLQGLIFQSPNDLMGSLKKIGSKLQRLHSLSEVTNIPLSSLCINFVLLNKNIDKVIVGVDSLKNLKENIKALSYQNEVKERYQDLINLKEDDENLILPINWKVS